VAAKVKEVLYNNTNLIIDILEDLGCHKITKNNKEIRCALPDGDNPSSVKITLSEFLGCKVYTRNKFDDYKFTDIFTLICFLRKIKFEDALQYTYSKVGLKYSPDTVITKINILNELRKYKRKIKKHEEYNHKILNKSILNKYEIKNIEEWGKEGISFPIQKKYNIRFDKQRNRILIPIYDGYGELISLKGRTCYNNHQELKIPKYIYYYELGVNDILFGLNYHKDSIKKELILFEGEKSVMKAEEYGFFNTVATATHSINEHLIPKILNLKCDVIIAFDKNETFSDIKKEAIKLSKFTNVYVIYDKNNFLGEKDAPVDKGKEVWKKLYNSKMRIN
jgi:hypothetical protein